MTNDIIRTINAGGTVMISKRTVEDAGRYAIYVYAILKVDGSSSAIPTKNN